MSRPIRKFIAFSSPLLLGIPPVDHRNFSGKITKQSAVRLADQHNHEISIVEVSGTQKSAQVELSAKAGAYFGCHYRNREIADSFYNRQNAIYFPNKPARGNSPGLAGRYLSHSPVFLFLYDPGCKFWTARCYQHRVECTRPGIMVVSGSVCPQQFPREVGHALNWLRVLANRSKNTSGNPG